MIRKILFLLLIIAGAGLAQDQALPDSRWDYTEYTGWTGMNLTSFPTKLGDKEASLLENLRFNTIGTLYKREGFRKFASVTENDSISGGFFPWYPLPDTIQYIWFVDNSAWTFEGLPTTQDVNFTKETSRAFKTKADYYGAQFFDRFYFCNGKDSNFYYDWQSQDFKDWGIIDTLRAIITASPEKLTDFFKNEPYKLPLTKNVPQFTYVEADLNNFFIRHITTGYTKRWHQIVLNTPDTITLNATLLAGEAGAGSGFEGIFEIRSLPVSGNSEDSGTVANTINGTLDGKWRQLKFVSDFASTNASAETICFFIHVYSGKGAGFQGQAFDYKVNGTTDTFICYVDTAQWQASSFDTGSKWKLYRRLPLSSGKLVDFKGRYFYAGNYNSGETGNLQPNLPNLVYFSRDINTGNYTPDWIQSTNFLSFDTRDGDIITGLTSQFHSGFANEQDRLIVFKSQRIFEVYVDATGFAPQDFVIFEVTNNLGCIAPKTIARQGNTILFFSAKGLYTKDPNNQFRLISAPIQKHLDKINRKYLNNCAGAVIGNDYFFSTPDTAGAGSGRDTTNSITWAYSFITNGWTKLDIKADFWSVSPLPTYRGKKSAGGMASGLGSPATPDTFQYIFTASRPITGDTVRAYSFGYSKTDSGQRIQLTIETKKDDFGAPELQKRVREIYIEYSKFDTSGDWIPAFVDDTVYFEVYNDFDNALTFADTGLTSGTLYRRIDLPTTIVNRLTSFKIKTRSPTFDFGSLKIKRMILSRRLK